MQEAIMNVDQTKELFWTVQNGDVWSLLTPPLMRYRYEFMYISEIKLKKGTF